MMSGRFRSEHLARHWSKNKLGYCLADTCGETTGDLEHLLVHCPALTSTRERLWTMYFEHSVMYPALFQFLSRLEKSLPQVMVQFLMDPTAFPEIWEIWELFGQPAIDLLSDQDICVLYLPTKTDLARPVDMRQLPD